MLVHDVVGQSPRRKLINRDSGLEAENAIVPIVAISRVRGAVSRGATAKREEARLDLLLEGLWERTRYLPIFDLAALVMICWR